MSPLRAIYLALAAGGAAVAVLTGGLGWPLAGWQAQADLWIAAAALAVWAVAETWVRRNWWALVAVPVAFGVGVGCGLALYLYLRTRPVT